MFCVCGGVICVCGVVFVCVWECVGCVCERACVGRGVLGFVCGCVGVCVSVCGGICGGVCVWVVCVCVVCGDVWLCVWGFVCVCL